MNIVKQITQQVDRAGSQGAIHSQKILMQSLHKHQFSSKTIIPLHNPRLRLGKLIPEKCKVMQSKKVSQNHLYYTVNGYILIHVQMPIWLWMSNVHPSALQPVPYKLIVKNGDDLCQDMLTLQMLTLFDKVSQWTVY